MSSVLTALALLTRIASSPLGPTGLAYVPEIPGGARVFEVDVQGRCLLRFEGTESGVNERIAAVSKLLGPTVQHSVWHDSESAAIWRNLRDAAPVAAHPVVLKLSLPPTRAAEVAGMLAARQLHCWYLDAAGAWLWIGVDTGAAMELVHTLREQLRPAGASVVIMRAPAEIKTAAGVLTPQPDAQAALTGRLKQSFDPQALFNPGRLYPG